MEWLKIRRIAFFSCIAAVVSILSAGIGGISFLRIILRALISAVSFGVFMTGLFWLIHRFLPEMFSENESAEKYEEETTGTKLNMVVEDDIPMTSASPSSHGIQPQSVDDAGKKDSENEEDMEVLEEKKSVATAEGIPDFNESGKLPDIESFTSDFSESEESGEKDGKDGNAGQSDMSSLSDESSSYTSIRSSNDEARDYFKENSTPEEMAKAVRTVVKRDE